MFESAEIIETWRIKLNFLTLGGPVWRNLDGENIKYYK